MDCAGFLSLILIMNFRTSSIRESQQKCTFPDWYPSVCRVQKLNDSRAHSQKTSAHPPRAAYDRRAHSPLHLHTSARFERHKKPSELTSVADLDHAELFSLTPSESADSA